jgi:hypothetical protein
MDSLLWLGMTEKGVRNDIFGLIMLTRPVMLNGA